MEPLLNLLADGGFHSGEALGNALGVSRAAVWKKMKALEELGLQLDSVRGKGYRLHPGIELLDRQVILDGLEPTVKDQVEVDTCLQTTSTMDRVRELSASRGKKLSASRGKKRSASRYKQLSAASPQSGHMLSDKKVFCVTEYQSCGRGRRGRNWSNPFGSTICLSLRWPFSEGMASLEGLSLAVGLAVLQALENCGADGLKLKWPNDVLWEAPDGFRKLSGILLEVYGDPTGDCEVVIGIGVNIALSQQQLAAIGQPATDMLRVCGQAAGRNAVVSSLVNTLCYTLNRFSERGFALFRDEWIRHDAFLGQEVALDASGRKVSGRACGVNSQGGLLLETPEGMMTFNGGEVSLRVGREIEGSGQREHENPGI